MKKKYFFSVGLVLILGLLGYSLVRLLLNRSGETEQEAGVSVIVTRPERGFIERTLRYSGTLLPENTITIVSKVPGEIEEIFIKEGDLVSGNQLLVRIEDDSVRLQMDQAYAAWQAAEAQFEKAKKGVRSEELENTRALLQKAEEDLKTSGENFKRAEQLYKGGAISKAGFEEAESAFRAAKTEPENARRTLKMLEEGGSEEEQRMARSQAEAMEANYELGPGSGWILPGSGRPCPALWPKY